MHSAPSPSDDSKTKRLEKYAQELKECITALEQNVPEWESKALFSVIETSLRLLRKGLLETKSVPWNEPFVGFEYPVDWDWDRWGKSAPAFAARFGCLTDENTNTRECATDTMAEILCRHQIYETLLHLTHYVGLTKDGETARTILPEEECERIARLKGRAQKRALEELLLPFSIGAANIELADDLKPGDKISKRALEQFRRADEAIDIREMCFDTAVEGRAVVIRLIFQLYPLTIDEAQKRAFFPITVGFHLNYEIAPVGPENEEPESTLNLGAWDDDLRTSLLDDLIRIVAKEQAGISPEADVPAHGATERVSRKIEIEVAAVSVEEIREAVNRLLASLGQTTSITSFRVSETTASSPSQIREQTHALLANLEAAKTADEKGKTLEKLMATLLNAVPGFEVSTNSRTATEEIDIKVLNSNNDPRWRNDTHILLECKNWSGRCGKNEIVLFERKLENRRGRAKLGFLVSWGGFSETVSKELLRGSREQAMIGLVDGAAVRRAVEAGDILPELRLAFDQAGD